MSYVCQPRKARKTAAAHQKPNANLGLFSATDAFADERLDLRRFTQQQADVYRLLAVAAYTGDSRVGHYVCFKKTKDVWIKADDEKCEVVEDACEPRSNPRLALYERVPPQ